MRKMAGLLLLVALTGCGGGDDDSSTPATSPPTTRPQVELDKERAARAVLTAADLPGYTEDTSPDDDTPEASAAFAACVQNDPVLTAEEPANPRTVDGKTFTKGETTSVNSKVVVAETEGQASAALAKLRERTVLDCIGRAARTSLATVGTVSNVSVTSLPVGTAGDEAVGFRTQATLSAEGQSVRLIIDATAVRKERAVALLTTGSGGTAFPESERAALATKVAGRMAP